MLNESFIAVVVHFAPLDIGMNSSSRKKIVIFIREWKIVLCELFTIFLGSANAAHSKESSSKNFFLTFFLFDSV
jgi:hypothetical protein